MIALDERQRSLVESHINLVHSIASKWPRSILSYQERVDYGMDGLIRAAARYRDGRGATFASFAYGQIRYGIFSGMRDGFNRVIHLPRNSEKRIPEHEHRRLRRVVSGSTRRRGSTIPPALDSVQARGDWRWDGDRERLWNAARTLGAREAAILAMYYGYEWPMRRIGERLGISESAVSQIIKRSLTALRSHPRVKECVG